MIMTRSEWMAELKRYISILPQKEQSKAIEYYAEIFDDKFDSGMSEKDIIDSFGEPYEAANDIIKVYQEDNPDWQRPAEFYTHRATTLPESSYRSISIECSLADITVKQEGTVYAYTLPKQSRFSVTQSADGSKLSIRQKEKWFSLPVVPEVTLVIPENAAGCSLSLKTDCGSVTAKELTAVDALEAQANAGSITLEALALSGRLEAKSNAGSINISGATACNATVSANAGSVSARNSAFNGLDVESDAGKVTLADISAGSIQAKTEAGSLHVEEIQSDKIILSTKVGSIKGTIAAAENEYTITIVQNLGNCNLNNRVGNTAKQLQIRTEMGGIHITFTK